VRRENKLKETLIPVERTAFWCKFKAKWSVGFGHTFYTKNFTEIIIYATADEAVAYMFYRCFYSVFFPSVKNMRQPLSGTAERIFMKLLPNDRGNVVCIAVFKWGLGPQIIFWGLKTEKSEWRHLANVDDLRNLRYDSGAITRGRHARRLRYKNMSARMHLI